MSRERGIMQCFLCKQKVNTGVGILQRKEVFMILCTTDPDNWKEHDKVSKELKEQGWSDATLCLDCEDKL
jgi:hypothetical protein